MAAGSRLLGRQGERGAPAGSQGLRPGARGVIRGHQVRAWLAAVAAATVIGTSGYVVGLGWSFWDGLYMTLISLTTVGFREVRDLDTAGRVWTMGVAVSGVAIIFGGVGIMAESLFSGATAGERERRRVAETGPLAGRSVGQLQDEGIHTLAIVRGDRQYEANPPSDRQLAPGDSLIVSGAAEPLRRLRELS